MPQPANTPPEKPKAQKRYVREYGTPAGGAASTAVAIVSMMVLALIVGFLAGAVVWALLGIVNLLTDLVWVHAAAGCGVPWFSVVACTAGGILIAWWTHASHNQLQTLEQVLGQVKQTGGYKLDNVWKTLVSFALPLMFGGSVGPEAGLSGIIAGACTQIGTRLKRAGLRSRAVADISLSAVLSAVFGTPLMGIITTAEDAIPNESEYTFSIPVKVVLYTCSAVGAFAGAALIALVPGLGGGLPRFDAMGAQGAEHLWAIPLALVGWVLALLYHVANRASLAASDKAKAHGRETVLPVICGVALGLVAVFLPNVLFSGEREAVQIIDAWTAVSATVLLLTGLVKVAATPLCINFGWRGGAFFPTIYAGISFGYGVAMLTGIDPVLCVLSITTALVAGMTRRPLLTLALLLLCFPLQNIVTMVVAALIGSFLPMPKGLAPNRPRRRTGKAAN